MPPIGDAPQSPPAPDTNGLGVELGALDDAVKSIKGNPDPATLDAELIALDDAVAQLKAKVQSIKDANGGASPEVAAMYQQLGAR
jgi:hypothetical protein